MFVLGAEFSSHLLSPEVTLHTAIQDVANAIEAEELRDIIHAGVSGLAAK